MTDSAQITDAEWRAFQLIPDQGYSHRAWVDARIRERMAQAWDEAIEHVWELSDPIDTVERYDGLAMVNTVADMRQAKRENPYCAAVTPPGSESR